MRRLALFALAVTAQKPPRLELHKHRGMCVDMLDDSVGFVVGRGAQITQCEATEDQVLFNGTGPITVLGDPSYCLQTRTSLGGGTILQFSTCIPGATNQEFVWVEKYCEIQINGLCLAGGSTERTESSGWDVRNLEIVECDEQDTNLLMWRVDNFDEGFECSYSGEPDTAMPAWIAVILTLTIISACLIWWCICRHQECSDKQWVFHESGAIVQVDKPPTSVSCPCPDTEELKPCLIIEQRKCANCEKLIPSGFEAFFCKKCKYTVCKSCHGQRHFKSTTAFKWRPDAKPDDPKKLKHKAEKMKYKKGKASKQEKEALNPKNPNRNKNPGQHVVDFHPGFNFLNVNKEAKKSYDKRMAYKSPLYGMSIPPGFASEKFWESFRRKETHLEITPDTYDERYEPRKKGRRKSRSLERRRKRSYSPSRRRRNHSWSPGSSEKKYRRYYSPSSRSRTPPRRRRGHSRTPPRRRRGRSRTPSRRNTRRTPPKRRDRTRRNLRFRNDYTPTESEATPIQKDWKPAYHREKQREDKKNPWRSFNGHPTPDGGGFVNITATEKPDVYGEKGPNQPGCCIQ